MKWTFSRVLKLLRSREPKFYTMCIPVCGVAEAASPAPPISQLGPVHSPGLTCASLITFPRSHPAPYHVTLSNPHLVHSTPPHKSSGNFPVWRARHIKSYMRIHDKSQTEVRLHWRGRKFTGCRAESVCVMQSVIS